MWEAAIPLAGAPTTTRRGWTTWPTTSRGRAAMAGAADGAEAARTIVVSARTLYEYQEFNFRNVDMRHEA